MTFDLPLAASSEAASAITEDGSILRRTILPGGVRVFTETMPGVRSATVGAWVGIGSRDETGGHFGSTHFLEHLLFKGTPHRSAHDIAAAFDAVGGESNAVTGKEHTCYYAKVIDTDLPMATGVIMDMVTSSLLASEEFELERGVICEEIAMNADDPHDVVHEKFAEAVFGPHPLGRPIGGTVETIRSVSRDAVDEHYHSTYRTDTLTVTAAGNVSHEQVCDVVMAGVRSGGWATGAAQPAARRQGQAEFDQTGRALVVARPDSQVNLIVGCEGLRIGDERRYASSILSAALGGGMSSRLFQEVREKRGLAYSVYSFGQGHADTGLFGMYAGCTPTKAAEVEKLLVAELERLAADGLTDAELDRAKGQLAGSLVLGLEETSARMSRLGKAELWLGRLETISEVVERIHAVTSDDVRALAALYAGRPRSVVRVGP